MADIGQDALAEAAHGLVAAQSSFTTDTIDDNAAVGVKRDSAAAFFSNSNGSEEDVGESDVLQDKTTLDDVLVSPVLKKVKLLDADLPDVDDEEEFPKERDELADLAADNGKNGTLGQEEIVVGDDDLEDVDMADLAPPPTDPMEQVEEEEGDGADTSDVENVDTDEGANNGIDIVDVDEEEDEEEFGQDEESAEEDNTREYQHYGEQDQDDEDDDEDEDEEEQEQARIQNANKQEARELLHQLDSSTRSKLCLTALEKYGEDLFYGHEAARDAILVDACGQDSILSMMKEAIRLRNSFARGTSAAPLEVDDDEEEEESDGDEDDSRPQSRPSTQEEDDDEEDDDEDDEIVLISEEETEETNGNLPQDEENEVDDGEEEDEEDEDDEEENADVAAGVSTVGDVVG